MNSDKNVKRIIHLPPRSKPKINQSGSVENLKIRNILQFARQNRGTLQISIDQDNDNRYQR